MFKRAFSLAFIDYSFNNTAKICQQDPSRRLAV